MRNAEAIGKHWCLVFVAYSLLHLDCLPPSPTKGSLPIKTIGEACRQQAQALMQALILYAHERLQLGQRAEDIFAYLFAKQQTGHGDDEVRLSSAKTQQSRYNTLWRDLSNAKNLFITLLCQILQHLDRAESLAGRLSRRWPGVRTGVELASGGVMDGAERACHASGVTVVRTNCGHRLLWNDVNLLRLDTL